VASSKTAKVQAEIDKARAKLAEQQARIKELEAKRTELENLEIIDIVRGLNIPLDNLAATLQSIKGGAAVEPSATSGQLGPKSVPVKNTIGKEDDIE
jgi:hypothetical protein